MPRLRRTESFIIFLYTISAVSLEAFVLPKRPSYPRTTVLFSSRPDVQLGSEQGQTPDNAEDEDQLKRDLHQKRVNQLLQESDDDFYQKRKSKKWGHFAEATNAEELQELVQKEQEEARKLNEKKQLLAQQSGVQMSVLAPLDAADPSLSFSIGSAASRKDAWFGEMDEDLKEEWNQLTGISDEDEEGDDVPAVELDQDGQVVTRNSRAGVRIGSAGGWTLEIFPGDFVVHRKFGIGRFEQTCLRSKTKLSKAEQKARDERRAEILTAELKKRKQVTAEKIQEIRSVFGTPEDRDPVSNPQTTVLEIQYADATVHVPVDRAYRLSRYRAGDAIIKPKLSRVRGEAWQKAKQRVEDTTKELAQNILSLYVKRETLSRAPCLPTYEDSVKAFEASFPFEPTPDQIKCFEDVENDMVWRSRPMDRLVCGDVGFGKTEVAMRALYRAVANGRQCALLAPTGVLAAQHYKNLLARMGPDTPYNVSIALLRGGSARKSKTGQQLVERIGSGEVQLVVGTHALLSDSIEYQNLQLLVIDEEQRFGVKQKDKLRVVSSGIDVLTLSATPIPRTLQMSISGVRDTSTIRSPPPMRKPTITYVQDFNEEVLELAIRNELERGGQCYYVVPRIALLDDAESVIRRLFPDLRVIQAHGRMQRNGAEDNVARFAEGEYDVLLATTVIENGVDIPATNTIIVQDAHMFGMSTLYQLRGRVGRSDKQAYAFFFHRANVVTETATQRLSAIADLNELGSGFDVATRDMEIRGAGSLLGTEQSGMAARVGYDLYMRMLKKSIRKLRGIDLPIVPRTNMVLKSIKSPDSFVLPATLIPNDDKRRKEEAAARLAESSETLVELTNRWKAEHGPLPAAVQVQLKTLHLNACARRLGIDLIGLVNQGDKVDCIMRSPGLRPRHWGKMMECFPRKTAPKGVDVFFPGRLTISGGDEIYRGGEKVDVSTLLEDEFVSEDQEDEEWDAMDKEEFEAMEAISSVAKVKNTSEVDLTRYPCITLVDFRSEDKAVDRLLKVLLPLAKARDAAAAAATA